jgi:predicted NAD-dependent protein-ADP-ribosyltransferase YbiA (DUF1768 family)
MSFHTNVIDYRSVRDPLTGFLNNDSATSFVLDEKRWPSVTHYVEAKKFEGTHFEDIIRRAPTVFQARRLTKEKSIFNVNEDGSTSKVRVYGIGNNYYMRDDWKTSYPQILEEGIRAKFDQNSNLRKYLIETGTYKLQGGDSLTDNILTKLRNQYQREFNFNNLPLVERTVYKSFDFKDYPYKPLQLSDGENDIVVFIIQLIKKLQTTAKLKDNDNLYKIAIYNLTPDKKVALKLIDYVNLFETADKKEIKVRMPNFRKLVNLIHEVISEEDVTQKFSLENSLLIANVLRWLRCDYLGKKNVKFVLERARTKEKFKLLRPPVPKSQVKVIPKKEVVTTQQTYTEESAISWLNTNTLKVVNAGEHKEELLRIGGREEPDGDISFSVSLIEYVEDILYRNLEEHESFSLRRKTQLMLKYFVIFDVIDEVRKYNNINTHNYDIEMLLSSIFGLEYHDGYDERDVISEVSNLLNIQLTEEELEVLSKYDVLSPKYQEQTTYPTLSQDESKILSLILSMSHLFSTETLSENEALFSCRFLLPQDKRTDISLSIEPKLELSNLVIHVDKTLDESYIDFVSKFISQYSELILQTLDKYIGEEFVIELKSENTTTNHSELKSSGNLIVDETIDITNFKDAKWVGLCIDAGSKRALRTSIQNKVYKKFHYADAYSNLLSRKMGLVYESYPRDSNNEILDSSSSHRYVVNMITSVSPGKPKRTLDNSANRELWFNECIKNLTKIDTLKNSTIVFDINHITEEYMFESLKTFAEENNTKVYIGGVRRGTGDAVLPTNNEENTLNHVKEELTHVDEEIRHMKKEIDDIRFPLEHEKDDYVEHHQHEEEEHHAPEVELPKFVSGVPVSRLNTEMARGSLYYKLFGNIGLTDHQYDSFIGTLEEMEHDERILLLYDLSTIKSDLRYEEIIDLYF